VQDLLTLTRRNIASKKVVNLNQIVNDLITSPEYCNIIGNRSNLTMKTMLSEDMLNILGSDAHLSKTVMNLLANAADAMPAGGEITVSTKDCYIDTPYTGFETVPQGEYAVLEVSDLGIGMSSSDLEKIFGPFYTKKAMRRLWYGPGNVSGLGHGKRSWRLYRCHYQGRVRYDICALFSCLTIEYRNAFHGLYRRLSRERRVHIDC